MNIFHKVALQGLKKNRTRTVVTVIGVVLSAALITAVLTFGVSLLHYMADGAAHKYGDWHVAFLDVDSSFARERALDAQVSHTVTFEQIGYAPLNGEEGQNKPYLFIAGFQPETFDALPISLISGRLPENSGELLISGKMMKAGGSYAVGETLSLPVGSRMRANERLGQGDPYVAGEETLVIQGEKTYRVVGVCQTPVFEQDASPGYTALTRADAQDGADRHSLFVTLKNPRKVHAYADSTSQGHAFIFNDDVLRVMGLSKNPADKVFSAILYALSCIVIAIIMVGSIFLIYNAFSISLGERTRQIGILSSVGATAKQLRNSVLFEGLCIGAIGIPIGVLVGLCSIGLALSAVGMSFGSIFYTDVPLTLHVSALAVAAAATVSMVTILISAYIPARRAAGAPVMECIRQTNDVKIDLRTVRTPRWAQRLYGLEGVLALKNFKRNKKRYRSIVLSLVLSIVLFISTSALVADMRQMTQQAEMVTDYDIGLGTMEMEDGELTRLYDEMKGAEGVYDSAYQAVMTYVCAVRTDELTDACRGLDLGPTPEGTVNLSARIQFLSDDAYMRIIEGLGLPPEEYAGPSAKAIAVAKLLGDGNASQEIRDLADMFAVPSMDLTLLPGADGGAGLEQAERISVNVAFFEIVPPDTPPATGSIEQQPYFFQVIAPWSLRESLALRDDRGNLVVKGMTFQSKEPSKSTAQMRTAIQESGITASYLLFNTVQAFEENRNYVLIANVFAYTFIVMISLIAVANVFNTISTNIKLRRQELAMLRSVGMADRDFNKMMRMECVFYGVRALLFGLPLAVLCSFLIHGGMVGDEARFVLPWSSIVISVVGVLFIIMITMMYAVSRIKRENIIDALRDDMT